jgi:hypothetical protein
MTIDVLNILDTAQPFVDDAQIAASQGLARRFHPAVKHSEEPVLAGTLECEGNIFVPVSVLKDQPDGGYRMWYLCHHEDGRQSVHCALSPDGLSWEKPALQDDGSNLNTFDDGSPIDDTACRIIHDVEEPNPSHRYKMLYYRQSYFLAYSPDGIVWTPHSKDPVWPNGSGDGLEECFFFLRDDRLGKWRGYMRVWQRYQTIRLLSLGESDDLIEWSGPTIIWGADPEFGAGAQIYGMNVFIDEGVYWGLPWMFYSSEPLEPRDQQTIRLKLGVSHEGREWQAVFPDQDVVALGEPSAFDSEMIHSFCPVVEGADEHRFYYCGHSTKHVDTTSKPGGIGLATFRRNGFVSLHAEEEGILLTKRFLFKGNELRINAKTTEAGSIEAELLADNGDLMDGFSYADSDSFTSDATGHALSWRGNADLSSLAGQALMLRLRLRQADLFAFRAAGPTELFMADSKPPPVRCGICTHPPVIDGKLDDNCWQDFGNSGVAEDFVMFEKLEPAPVKTRAMFTRDHEHLYLSVDCEEPLLDQLVVKHEENEPDFNFSEDDMIEFRLSAPGQGTFFNQLCVNAAGKRFQAWFSVEEGGSRVINNVDWQAAVSQLSGHWFVEMAVPFAALDTPPPATGDRWQLHVIRHRQTDGYEVSCWSCMFGKVHRNDLSGVLAFS